MGRDGGGSQLAGLRAGESNSRSRATVELLSTNSSEAHEVFPTNPGEWINPNAMPWTTAGNKTESTLAQGKRVISWSALMLQSPKGRSKSRRNSAAGIIRGAN